MVMSPLMRQNSPTLPGKRLVFTRHILIVLYLRGITLMSALMRQSSPTLPGNRLVFTRHLLIVLYLYSIY